MKEKLRQKIANQLFSNHYYYLLLLSSTLVLVISPNLASLAKPIEIAQANIINKINRPNLQIGSRGERVLELQAALKLLGFYTGVVNGIYQENTAQAVYQFKQAAGLTPNNVVDSQTWQKLFPSVSTVTTNSSRNLATPTSRASLPVPNQRTVNVRNNNNSVPKPQPSLPATPQKTKITPANISRNSFQPTPVNQRNPDIQYTAAGWPILRRGSSGQEVMKLQTLLQTLGFLQGAIDGDFGAVTETAVQAAQIRYGLQPDGIVGGSTWNAFLQRLR
ncbi:MAG: peptidoglycan-binding protein [Sphaerospermopsis sp. SIO1G2]|nr:peptidoglycan-binding protein [Sphaerospermopsis sp. SIO1G1]NET74356.1 peptidoglycan-binding protein [Sphaerospermopsis sp. SIO1G2]